MAKMIDRKGWIDDFYFPSKEMEFKFETADIDYSKVRQIFDAPAETPIYLKMTFQQLTQKKLHKKKRISKKWAKQGKYKKVLITKYFNVEDIKTYEDDLEREFSIQCGKQNIPSKSRD